MADVRAIWQDGRLSGGTQGDDDAGVPIMLGPEHDDASLKSFQEWRVERVRINRDLFPIKP